MSAVGGAPEDRRWRRWLLPFGSLAVFLLVWEAGVRLAEVPAGLLPPPSAVAGTLVREWRLLLWHTWRTVAQCLLGFLYAAIGGTVLGAMLAVFRPFRDAVYPLVVAFQVVPKVALAPLFVLWFGLGSGARVVLVFVIAFFPMVINTFTGLLETDADMLRMARGFCANRWQIFWKVRLPTAVPYVLSGVKISVTLAVVGIIVGEFVTAQDGLGYLIAFSEGTMDSRLLMAALVVLSVVGWVLYWLVSVAERFIVRWEAPDRAS